MQLNWQFPRLIWHTPALYFKCGLFLKYGNRRYCILPLWRFW